MKRTIMPEPSFPWLCVFAVFLGGILQGCLGFGFAFIALPIFARFFSPLLATPMIVSLSLILNFIVFFSCFKHANKKIISWLLIGGIAGAPPGVWILKHVDSSSYSLMAGVLIMCSACLFLFDKRFALKDRIMNYVPVGFVSGILNAGIGLSGPPVILFMSNQMFEKNVMRATMIGYFLMINTFSLMWFIRQQMVSSHMIGCLMYFAPAVIAGSLLGIFSARFIGEHVFRKIILLCVMAIGLIVSFSSLLNFYPF